MSETNDPLNEWATSGTKTEPLLAKRQAGWLLEEAPAFENFNWQWAEWIDRFNFLYKNPSQSYNATVDYNGAGQLVKGSDNKLYVSVQSNGPGSTVQDPTTDVGDVFWQLLSSYLNLGTAAAANLGTGVGNVPTYASGQVLTGNVTGTAASWTTARTITMTGEVSGAQTFDGTGNFSVSCTLPNAGTMFTQDAGVAGGEFRTNAQNEAVFVQPSDRDPVTVWTGSDTIVTIAEIFANTAFVVIPGIYTLTIDALLVDETYEIVATVVDDIQASGSCGLISAGLNLQITVGRLLASGGTGDFRVITRTEGVGGGTEETITKIEYRPL